jgi:hypothetical protein
VPRHLTEVVLEVPKAVAITGASGLIGGAITSALEARGDRVRKLVRRPPRADDEVRWDPHSDRLDPAVLEGIDAVVHLAGRNVGDARWSDAVKNEIRASRVDGTRLLAEALASGAGPAHFISASGASVYGDRGDTVLDEDSGAGSGFLADVVTAWEAAADPARDKGVRVVHARLGVVFARDGGALDKMLLPFRMGAGGRLGSGKQYMPFVALDDALAAFLRLLDDESLSDVFNVTAKAPATNAELTRALGAVLHRPTVMAVPAFALRIAMGTEMANELLLASQRVVPKRLLDVGFEFAHPTIEDAVRAAVRS